MESWVLEGDSYSFLPSAPHNFNLQHLDGPNRVEIFDITSVPSHRSAISETTCLCDIFGDDCESPSLSSSPASTSFLKKDVDEQLPVEDANDSSGSYHTANGSEHQSDGSDTFEDSKDTKDLLFSETGESNTPASDLTLPNDKQEVTSANGSTKPAGNWQESHLSQDTSLGQVENSSDPQLITSTSEFRDTNIRVTGSTQGIISPELLSENKGIRDQSHATSSELWETNSTQEIITPDLRHITKQVDASSSEEKENDSTEKIITPDSSHENRGTTASEVRETDSTQKNKYYKERESTFSENRDSDVSFSNLASEDSLKVNNVLGCSGEEEEKNSLHDILPTENISILLETVKNDCSVALTNISNDGSGFAPLKKAASDPPAKDETHDLREMSAPLEYENVPNKLAYVGVFLCDDKAGLVEDTVPPPTYVEGNTETGVESMPQHFTISSETRETVVLHEHRTVPSFSDTTDGLISCVISKLSSPSSSSVDVNSSEPPIIIHSPVGFTLCPSPEPMNKIWSAGTADLASTTESTESDYKLTPTDKGSISSFDLKLCPTPEPGSINSAPENRQNVFMCELIHAASSPGLRSASCSPEMKTMTCSSLTQHSKSPQIKKKAPQNNFTSQYEVLAQTHEVDGIIHAEGFISTARPSEEVADVNTPTICNLSSTQGGISSPSTTLPRDTVSLDLKGTRYTESVTPDILPTNEITNMAISSKFSSTDRCIISPHSSISIQRGTESPDIFEIRSEESSISTIPPANEIADMAISNLSSGEGGISTSPSALIIPRDTESPDVVGTRPTESSMSTTLPTKDIENVVSSPILHLSSAKGGIPKPFNFSAPRDTAPSDVDGIISVKGYESSTILTNETKLTAISPISNNLPTASNLSIPRDAMFPEVEGTRYAQSSVSTMFPIMETENVVITPITHLSSVEGGISISTSPLSILRDTMSPDIVGTRCGEISMSTISPTNDTTNMVISPISNHSSTEGGTSRPSSTISISRNTASPEIDEIRCMEIPTSTIILTNELTNMSNSHNNLSLTGSISKPPSNLSIPRDTTCLHAQEAKYMDQSNEISTNESTNMATSPIFHCSTTEGGIFRPPSISSISEMTASTDVDGLRCEEGSSLSILPTNEAPIMSISPVINISPTEGGLSNPPSTLSIPRGTTSPNVEGTRYTEISNEIPTNETTNMAISPISHGSTTEGGISRPPSASSISEITASTDVDGLRCEEGSTLSICPTDEAPILGISPVIKMSPTEGGLSNPPSALSIPRGTTSPNVEGTRYTEISNEIPTNETTNMAISPISHCSTTEGGISRPPSASSTSEIRASTDVDELRCVEGSTLSILPTNEAPILGISPVIKMSPTEGGQSNPPSALSIPRGTMSANVEGTRYTEIPNEIPTNEITISFTSNLSSTEGGISKPSSTLSIPRATMSPDVDGIRCMKSSASTVLPTNDANSPVYNFSSTEGGISRQPSNLSIPKHTVSPDVEGTRYSPRSNEIQTNESKNMASSISNLTTPSIILADRVSSPKIRYRKSPERFDDHVTAPEMCIPLGCTDNHLSTTVHEKVDLPLMVPVGIVSTDDTSYKMSLKSCSLPQDDCIDIASIPCSQANKISDSLPEPPAPILSVKQIKEGWERKNESILNSLNPWQTHKKILTVSTAKESKEGNDSGGEMLERESVGSEKTFGQMAMRPGESPSVLHSNNHSMYEGQSHRNKGWSGERVIQEELTLEKGVGNIAEGSYKGEQVELSFSTRNRKGPANHSPAPSSRDPKSGIQPRYFESPLATHRQQSLLRAHNLQKENKTGARRVQSTSQSNHCGAGRLSSETSSMGSEFDDADREVKWFADQAFRSLSSPQVDYLDVYNSSYGSSTNVSQPSTVDSPGSATWISYADLHDSLHENDDVLCHTSSFLPHGSLDPAKHFEMGSFECVDVALESKEETIRGKRTVPKRQIQFKRRNFDELKSTESEGIAMDSSSTQTCSRDTFVRQHSTPASMQEELSQGEHEFQTGKEMLQKSASLDESSPRNKMASSVIKSVLSKKMDTTTKESSRSEPHEDKNRHIETLAAAESSNAERQSSSLPCECSLSSEPFSSKEKRSPHLQKRSCRPKVPPKPVFNANCLPPSNSPTGVAFHCKTSVKDQIKPTTVDGFTNKTSKKHTFGNREKEASKLEEKYNNDSGNASNRTPNCSAICVASPQSRMTNSDNKHPMTPETHKQQEGSSSMFLSKTPEITLKSCTINDKNKSSLKASFCPELEITKDTICKPLLEETIEEQMKLKTGIEADKEEDNEKNKAKSVIHKVRDVRKLVKNTYNLSFKASNNTHHEEDIVPDKQKEMQVENPHPLHIECKAISWKDKTAPCNKSATQQDVAHTAENSKMPQTDSVIRRNVGITKITTKTSLSSVQHSDMPGLDKCKDISKSGNCEQSTKLEMPSRSPSKEISTLVFLQDGTPKSVQKPTSPASPNAKTINSSHSVSMLRKEKGMQADIGVCDVLSEGVGVKPKHINRLEVPLQTYASEATSSECQKMKNDDADLPPKQKTALNSSLQTREHTLQGRSSPKPKEVRILPNGKVMDNQANLLQPPKEQEITVAASSKAEVSAFSSNTKIHAMPVTTSKEIELPIQVRSISSDRPKPSVLPKPSYKQPVAEIRSTSNDFPKTDIPPTTSILKEQTHLKSDIKIIETSATVIHKEESTNTASSNTKTLAVPAVSSHKPQTIPVTTVSSSAQKSTATTGRQEISITSVQNSSNCQQQNIQEQVKEATSYAANYQNLPVNSEANTYMQPTVTTLSNKQLHTDDFHFPTSDDPPSYDERESFSPLHLSDLPPRRQHRYHPTSKHSVCSCTSCTHPQFGQPYLGSQNQTPPAPRSPGQVISYPGAPPQAQVRPHQCRPDGQHTNYPSASPKSIVQQAPAMIQPMHHPYTCPAPAIQPYVNEQQQPSTQHMDRRSGNQRSPQAPSGATYREHSRSPNIAAQDPRSQFFNPQELPPAFGHDFGSDGPGGGGMLYPENASGLGYGQGPRRVLLDPETGKYFYIEVPMQPLRKMLFDPEIGQYVEVLMPQQAMSNSSMYPPTAAPYQGPYHGQGLYTSQYLPYTMPPHPQSAQQPRHPEPSVPTSLHQHTMGYGSSASQMPKSDIKGHPSLDQSYLESMYYIPTGMNASPNSTPSDCCHKPTTNIPASGGRRA